MFHYHDGGGGSGVETLKLESSRRCGVVTSSGCLLMTGGLHRRTSSSSSQFLVSVGVAATVVVSLYMNFRFFWFSLSY